MSRLFKTYLGDIGIIVGDTPTGRDRRRIDGARIVSEVVVEGHRVIDRGVVLSAMARGQIEESDVNGD